MKNKFVLSVLNIIALCVIIFAVSVYFADKSVWMGYVLVFLALVCIVSLRLFRINLKSIVPDVLFWLIDNGILAIMAIFWGHFAGVTWAILGGVVGNAITDGIAWIFEWHYAEKLRLNLIPEERTMLKSAVWKMAGCLFWAGIVLIVASFWKF